MNSSMEDLNKFLNEILETNSEVKSALIVTFEGLPIASTSTLGSDEVKVSAITTVLEFLSDHLVIEMNIGELDQVNLQCSKGYLILKLLGPNAILTLSTTEEIKLEFLFSHLYHKFKEKIGIAFNKIKDLMNEQNSSTLNLNRNYLLELFDENLIETHKDGYPQVKDVLKQHFLLGGMKIEYSGDIIKISKIF